MNCRTEFVADEKEGHTIGPCFTQGSEDYGKIIDTSGHTGLGTVVECPKCKSSEYVRLQA
jgi:hypothetical protein